MKMMQPFDFRERVYGGPVWASRESHWNTSGQSRRNPHGVSDITYSGPRDFADVEEFVVTSDDNAVLFRFTRGSPALVHLGCEQTTSEGWER